MGARTVYVRIEQSHLFPPFGQCKCCVDRDSALPHATFATGHSHHVLYLLKTREFELSLCSHSRVHRDLRALTAKCTGYFPSEEVDSLGGWIARYEQHLYRLV